MNEKVSGQPDASITHQLNDFKKGVENEYCSLDYLVQMVTQQNDASSTAKLNDDQMLRIVLIELSIYLNYSILRIKLNRIILIRIMD